MGRGPLDRRLHGLSNTDPRTGKTATVENIYHLNPGTTGFVSGTVGVRSLARYCGVFVSNDGPSGVPVTTVGLSP